MFEERAVLPGGEILQLNLFDESHYRLMLRKGRNILIEYKGDGKVHSMTARGRQSVYAFKSVEKLRYDFERDAEDAQHQG